MPMSVKKIETRVYQVINKRPCWLTGVMSPYPTVANVMTQKYTASSNRSVRTLSSGSGFISILSGSGRPSESTRPPAFENVKTIVRVSSLIVNLISEFDKKMALPRINAISNVIIEIAGWLSIQCLMVKEPNAELRGARLFARSA